jgi:hypothetical protein
VRTIFIIKSAIQAENISIALAVAANLVIFVLRILLPKGGGSVKFKGGLDRGRS